MFFKELADVVRHYKETEEGREKMSQIIEELINEAVTEAVTETTENNRAEFAWNLLQQGKLTYEDIAAAMGLSIERVREIAEQKVA